MYSETIWSASCGGRSLDVRFALCAFRMSLFASCKSDDGQLDYLTIARMEGEVQGETYARLSSMAATSASSSGTLFARDASRVGVRLGFGMGVGSAAAEEAEESSGGSDD